MSKRPTKSQGTFTWMVMVRSSPRKILRHLFPSWCVTCRDQVTRFGLEAWRDLRKNLQGMETSPVSYVIFMTENARWDLFLSSAGCPTLGKGGIFRDLFISISVQKSFSFVVVLMDVAVGCCQAVGTSTFVGIFISHCQPHRTRVMPIRRPGTRRWRRHRPLALL